MSNLGKYQDFTILAKSVGGVDKFIEDIGEAAVMKAAPKLVVVSIVAGGALALGAKALLEKYRATQKAGHDAEDQLRAKVEQAANSSEPAVDQTDDLSDPDEPIQP